MRKAWCSLEEVPYCFSRPSVKFQGHTAKKMSILTQSGHFRTVTPVWIHRRWLWNNAQSLKPHRRKNCWFWPELSVSGLYLEFDFTDGFKMMHTAWYSIEKMTYCFARSSIKFQHHTRQNIANLDPNWAFLDWNSGFNSPMNLKWCTKLDAV